MTRTTLILVTFVMATGYGDSAIPTSPTPVIVPPPPPRQFDVRPVDSRFNDQFWQQLVFNQYDDPNPSRDRRWSRTFDNPSPNVYIKDG